MSLLRLTLRNQFLRVNSSTAQLLPTQTTTTTFIRSTAPQLLPHRYYATKGKTKSTAQFVPGSKQVITDEIALAEYNKAETSMKMAVDWFRKECQGFETRASGRVTPALLSPVRVKLDEKEYRLEEVATVGVRDGSILMVTLFEEKVSRVASASLLYCLLTCFLN
jgi:ribosome recycling factor